MKNQLWDLVNNIYKNSENKSAFVQKCNDYWDGRLHKDKQLFNDQDRTAFNIVKPIVETKLKAMLDAQFTLAVVPEVTSFSNLQTIKNHQAVADIFNDELHNIFSKNNMDAKKEIIARSGLNCGFGASQTVWNTDNDERGNVKITNILSEDLRWDKDATCLEDSTFVAYTFSLSPNSAKDKYCKNDAGEYDKEKCLKIDRIAEDRNAKGEKYSPAKSVVNYNTTSGGGQLFVKNDCKGITAGKVINLICIFLVDDSVYAPEKNDDKEETSIKDEGAAKYPNGRMIIFSSNEKEKLILEDKALPKNFNNLGNIDIFNSIIWGGIAGKGEVEDLFATQDRIDGLYTKYRKELQEDFTSIAFEKDEDVSESNLVAQPVMFLKPGSMTPQVFSNNGLSKAANALGMIEQLENHAAKMARVNETMIYGARQTGTTSGEQVEMLQESPLADIRAMQRNFKDYLINVGNKCLQLIKENYNVDRLIKLSTGLNDAEYAQIKMGQEEGQAPEISLINKAGEVVESIKMDPDWEFTVEVVAGTEVPRSRKEQAGLMNILAEKGIVDLQDIDMVEQYLRSLDVPNYRTLVQILRKKQEQAQKQAQDPESNNWKEMMKNPVIAKEFAAVFKSLTGYPKAQQQMLSEIGLPANPATLEDSPVTETTRESDVAEVATMVPNIISDNPEIASVGYDAARAEQLIDTMQ